MQFYYDQCLEIQKEFDRINFELMRKLYDRLVANNDTIGIELLNNISFNFNNLSRFRIDEFHKRFTIDYQKHQERELIKKLEFMKLEEYINNTISKVEKLELFEYMSFNYDLEEMKHAMSSPKITPPKEVLLSDETFNEWVDKYLYEQQK